MFLKKIKSEVVAHLSYLIGSEGEAFVVDPQRDCYIYTDLADRQGAQIKYIFETHRNEDYVIGSRELADMTGAEVYHGPWPEFQYGEALEGGEEFRVGKLKVTAIHTPGHTPGDMSYTVTDMDTGEETVLVCTGDTLFVGDTGRTDFGGPEKRREWSENLYNSIFNKLLPLGDHVIICPAHGSGSVCGGGIADRELSTLGLERLMHPHLQLSKEEFIDLKVNENHEYAPYFKMMEKYNVEGAPFVGCGPNPKAMSPEEFKSSMEEGALVVDTRSPAAFGGAHIEGSYSLPESRLSVGGWLLPYDPPILLVVSGYEALDYAVRSLCRMGYDNVKGYLAGGLSAWYKAGNQVGRLNLISVEEMGDILDDESFTLLDVRNLDEWSEGHFERAISIYLGHLEHRIDEVPKDKKVVIICKAGTRASIAASILLRDDRADVYNLLGGMDAIKKAGYPLITDSDE
ncbi:MAG: MBL fold metallo-hydrolase [Candidatus Bathyarchaeia archaeon]